MTKWVYQARVVPMGKPMLLPDNHGRPTTFTFDDVNFSQSRRNVGAGDSRSCSITIRNLKSGSSGR